MAKRNDNQTFLRAGQLTKGGRSPVGSIREVRKNAAASGQGFVNFPISRQNAANKSSRIDAYKQRVVGFWGRG